LINNWNEPSTICSVHAWQNNLPVEKTVCWFVPQTVFLFNLEGKVDADKELLWLNQKIRPPIFFFFFFCQND
jgi:hypothetical protein